MHKLNNITKILGATVLLVGSTAVVAETLTVPTTVTIDNTIDFSVTGTLDFGTIRATQDDTVSTCVGLTVAANPATANTATLGTDGTALCSAGAGDDVLQSVGGVITRPEFAVAGLAAFTSLTLTLPSSGTALVLSPAPAGAPGFTLQDFTAYQSSGTAGAVTTSVVADATGDIAFSIGATLVTDATTAGLAYQDVAYDGSFDVTVAY